MKTPWRFLADLVSRKSDAADDGSVPNDDVKAIEHYDDPVGEVNELKAQPSDTSLQETVANVEETPSEAVTDQAAREETETRSVVVTVPEADGSARADAHETQLQDGHDDVPASKPPEIPPAESGSLGKESRSRRKARAKSSNEVAGREQQVEVIEPVVAAASAEKSVFEEMAALDTEISVLRSALAKKLSIQNEQLRRVIARFD